MEWVETTGNTLDAAKEAALDELGVDEQDAEFEVLQEAKTGLFGRVRAEARIRARVRPTAPRAKEDRRDRRRSRSKDTSEDAARLASAGGEEVAVTVAATQVAERPAADGGNDQTGRNGGRRSAAAPTSATEPAPSLGLDDSAGSGATTGPNAPSEQGAPSSDAPAGSRNGSRNRRGRGRAGSERTNGGSASADDGAPRPGRTGPPPQSNDRPGEGPTVEVALEEQGRVAEEFLQGLLAQFGLQADIAVAQPDEDNVELAITGQDLGLLIGPKGATLLAIQDLTRTVVQRKTSAGDGRIHVDVGGYREKRAAALGNFARQVATQVVASGERRALEPMAPADRKVVHDALTDFEGVETLSEGEDPHRRVIIVPVG